MAQAVRAVKGTRVFWPRDSAVWSEVEAVCRRVFGSYGFGEIRTPVLEHNELFAAIREGEPVNDGTWMANSTMMSLIGRMAAYSGQTVSWEDAMKSEVDLTPPSYEFGDLPMPPVIKPGMAGAM